MARPARAREKILMAAEAIVLEHGASALTYEELVEHSGVTRGGITYHFPKKTDLLIALVEKDLEQWRSLDSALRPSDTGPEVGELIAFMRSHTTRSGDWRRLIAGMLSAVTHDPGVLEPIRRHERRRLEGITWDQAQRSRLVARMAAYGLFWAEFFGCIALDDDVRADFVRALEDMVGE